MEMKSDIIKDSSKDAVKSGKPSSTPDDIERRMGEMYGANNLRLEPSILGAEGIRYDFNRGVRVMIPHFAKRSYRVRYWDVESGYLLHDGVMVKGDRLQSQQFYYREVVLKISDSKTGENIIVHRFNLDGEKVIIHFPVETLGDTIAWFSAVEKFRKKHSTCTLYVAMSENLRPIFEPCHPDMIFVNREELISIDSYAQYVLGVDFNGSTEMMPYDWRMSPLHWVGANILGIDPHEIGNEPPTIHYDRNKRKIQEPYVCIGSMASGGCKLWMNPDGWDNIVNFLIKCGYRVIDIDGHRICGEGISYQKIPKNAEDYTGFGEGKTVADRAAMIEHADFFIGLGSGLSWLSWACHKPTVLISGFSQPFCEFHTPYRVINTAVCHGCFNDPTVKFDSKDCFWCPRNKGTESHLICSRSITADMVVRKILNIPEFQRHISSLGISIGDACCNDAFNSSPVRLTITQKGNSAGERNEAASLSADSGARVPSSGQAPRPQVADALDGVQKPSKGHGASPVAGMTIKPGELSREKLSCFLREMTQGRVIIDSGDSSQGTGTPDNQNNDDDGLDDGKQDSIAGSAPMIGNVDMDSMAFKSAIGKQEQTERGQ